MSEIAYREKTSTVVSEEWCVSTPLSRRNSQNTEYLYFKKDKHEFAVYGVKCRVQKHPRLSVGRFFREKVRRRSWAPPKRISANLGHVPIETVRTFIELLELPGGWNSYNAKQIRKENVNAAVSLLGRVMRLGTPAPIVVPKFRGGVQLEWHTNGVNLEIAIDSPDDITFFAEDIQSDQNPEQELDESTITPWIDRISRSAITAPR